MDKVTQYQRSSIQENYKVDPRARLRREQRSYESVNQDYNSRSVSPAQFIGSRQQVSRLSKKSDRSVSIGGHNHSIDSQPNNLPSAHWASQDSLKVQYQKVTDNLPTFHKRVKNIEPPEQKSIQSKLPEIQNLLASSPGKSQNIQSRSKSPIQAELVTPICLTRKHSEPGFTPTPR